jgi:tRNA (mo5U34)-methyltransferase
MAETLETEISKARSAAERELAALGPWFHNLHLPDGTETAPNHRLGDFPTCKWSEIKDHLPDDLSGWTALDVGCNAGFYSFELAKRGANVLGIDVEERYLKQARWAARRLDLDGSVKFEQMQVYDLARSRRTFDLVLFLGVFYHLRYPLLALDILSHKVNRTMVFQSLTIPGEGSVDSRADYDFEDRKAFLDHGWPKMAFVEDQFAGDPTNWWVPNHAGIEAMLRSAGMRITTRASHDMYLCEPDASPMTAAREFVAEQLRAVVGERQVDGNGSYTIASQPDVAGESD